MSKCDNIGYNGRNVMYEILEVTENLKQSINNWTNSSWYIKLLISKMK